MNSPYRKKKFLAALILLMILITLVSGCSTPYQSIVYSDNFPEGFHDEKIEKDSFTINFTSNIFTSPERITDFILLRSAELTLKREYKHFVIIDSHGYMTYMALLKKHTTEYSVTTIYRPSVSDIYYVLCLDHQATTHHSFDAELIFKKMVNKYHLKLS
ncbi:MAG: hypothetical protein HRU20_23085 [Pseudomonadales bacterium]|nr:hypothetical protein [Pseudomonadales bacterium]